ncbi:MAG TPA: 23S rRNA (adenine(2503)-C(2))-methyltransferase RlmN [Deltaproteobacteria bacterium]|nr:23S rRNA (adenine(2503)-C(2))-methyltransferase RlmN [Deltaproteobacteria bacterium]
MDKPNLKNFTQQELTDWVVQLGMKSFRGKQIFCWLYRPDITDFSQMTDISKEVRSQLAEKSFFSNLQPEIEERSKDGSVKYAFRLEDGKVIESVLIPEEERLTLCVSSQVGCAMGCRFCLTGTMGFVRNLSPAEIVGQVQSISEIVKKQGYNRINNLVFMGMGEPLANFDNLITALSNLMNQNGLDFSSRRITVSTCGLIPKIKELGEKVPVNLAISLHAADNETRNKLMPVNATYPVDELLAACRAYPLPNRRKIMIEYIMLKDINDSPKDAKLLIKKLHKLAAKVNLLPYNENKVFDFKSPPRERVEQFQTILRDAGITALLRESRGSDISAACGQLATLNNGEEES